MKRRLFKILLFSWLLVLPTFAIGCIKENVEVINPEEISGEETSPENEETEIVSKDNNDNSGNSTGFDFEKLGVTPYSDYPDWTEFELSDDLKQTIATMYSVVHNWEPSDISEEGWEDVFIQSFLLNSWYDTDYINSKNSVTKEEAEYIQYSLTGQKMSFDDMNENDVIDRSNSSSPFNRVYMDTYSVSAYSDPYSSSSDKGYLIYADIITQYSYLDENGELDMKDDVDRVAIILKENPYSCFEGLSIDSITIMPKQVKDYSESLFELVSMIIWLKDENYQQEYVDCLIADFLGEDIEEKQITAENGLTGYTNKRVEKSKLESFYKEVLGEERSFDTDHFTGEAGVICDKDGYCYAITSALPEYYTVIESTVTLPDGISVKAFKMNGIQGREVGELWFTMIPSDNEFGYVLKIEEEKKYDQETIRNFLAQKYTCVAPPFYTMFDHVTEEGNYVFHIFEYVVNEDEAHNATIDWVEVNPKTGEATTFFGETFYIEVTD